MGETEGTDNRAPLWMIALPPLLTGITCWLEAISATGVSLIVGAMLYGMWLEQRVWQPCIRERKAGRSGGKPEKPFPLPCDETPHAANNLGE